MQTEKLQAPQTESAGKVKFGVKSFLSICAILIAVMITVGILMYVSLPGDTMLAQTGKFWQIPFIL